MDDEWAHCGRGGSLVGGLWRKGARQENIGCLVGELGDRLVRKW